MDENENVNGSDPVVAVDPALEGAEKTVETEVAPEGAVETPAPVEGEIVAEAPVEAPAEEAVTE